MSRVFALTRVIVGGALFWTGWAFVLAGVFVSSGLAGVIAFSQYLSSPEGLERAKQVVESRKGRKGGQRDR